MEILPTVQSRIVEIQTQLQVLKTGRTGASSTTSAASFANAMNGLTANAEVGSGKNLVDNQGYPLEYKQYGNGQIPSYALSPIAGSPGQSLWAPAARSYEAMRADAAAEGINFTINDTYRDLPEQQEVLDKYGLYGAGGLASPVGQSNHGWGVCVDLQLSPAAQTWMRNNAGKYGYVENVAGEPWHWQYKPTK